jgi:hypothetical protein
MGTSLPFTSLRVRGRNSYCRLGKPTSSRVRRKAPVSKKFVVPSPFFRRSHSAPSLTRPAMPSSAVSESSKLVVYWMSTPGWFCRLRPTSGASAMTCMRCRRSSSGAPTPESISSLGVLTAPAQRITSRSQAIVRELPRSDTSIPSAAPFRMTTRVTRVRLSTTRLGRCAAGRRYAREELHRSPLWMKACATCKPSCLYPLWSGVTANSACSPTFAMGQCFAQCRGRGRTPHSGK